MYAFVAMALLRSFAPALCVSEFSATVQHVHALAGAGLLAAPDAEEETARKQLMVRCIWVMRV